MEHMTFQRARSEEQRELRRQSILDTATAMLDEMPASELSLNELSRRVGLAKSNVLRYFESREAVLLELLDQAVARCVVDLVAELGAIKPSGAAGIRGDRAAQVIAATLTRHRVLCDLIAAQPGVLEHNASVDVVLDFKRRSRDNLLAFAEALRGAVPELGERAAAVGMMSVVLAGALWAHSQHSASAQAAYDLDPDLGAVRFELPAALEEAIATFIAGTLARSGGKVRRAAAR